MIDQFLANFDESLYDEWKEHANHLIQELEQGFAKINFGAKTPNEVLKIKELIQAAKQSTDRKIFASNIMQIKDELGKLGTKFDFKNPQINNFFFSARRSFLSLMSFSLTKIKRYADAIVNPANKPMGEQAQLGMLQQYGVEKGAAMVGGALVGSFDANVVGFMRAQVDAMPQCEVAQDVNFAITTTPPSLLAQRLGPKNYQQLQSQIHVNSSDTAVEYIAEQTHGYAFEFYYTQVATMMDTLYKVDFLSDGNPQRKAEMLAQLGLSELSSSATAAFLDNVATTLGFESAKALHKNYQNIDTQKGFGDLQRKKFAFMKKANDQSITIEQDPLEKIIVYANKEHDRVKQLMQNPGFSKTNAHYCTLAYCLGNDIPSGIRTSQRVYNLIRLVAQDYFDMNKWLGKEEERGFFVRMLGYAGDLLVNRFNFKSFLDSKLHGIFLEGGLIDQRVMDNTNSQNDQYDEKIQQLLKENEPRVQQIQKSMAAQDHHDLISQFVSRMITAGSSTDPKVKLEYKNFKQAFIAKTRSDLKNMSKNQLQNYIDNHGSATMEVNETRDRINTQINESNKSIRSLNNQINELPISGWDRFWGAFGLKTSKVKKLDQLNEAKKTLIRELQAEEADLNEYSLELRVRSRLLHQATSQVATIKELESMSVSGLLDKTTRLTTHLENDYRKLRQHLPVTDEKDAAKKMRRALRACEDDEHHFNMTFDRLNSELASTKGKTELKAIPLTVIQSRLEQIKKFRDNLSSKHPLWNRLNILIDLLTRAQTERIKEAQNNLFTSAKALVEMQMRSESITNIIDPFSFIKNKLPPEMADLTPANRLALDEHIQMEYTKLFEVALPNLTRQHLEQIYYYMQRLYHFHSNKDKPNDEDKKIAAFTQEFLSKVEQHYLAVTDSQPVPTISQLDQYHADFNHYYNECTEANTELGNAKSTFESYFWNPIGLVSKETVKQAQEKKAAKDNQFQLFAKSYVLALRKLSDNGQAFADLSQTDLKQTIQKYEANLQAIRNMITKEGTHIPQAEQIIQYHEQIIRLAKTYDLTPFTTEIALIKGQLPQLEADLTALVATSQEINNKIEQTKDFDLVLFEKYMGSAANLSIRLQDLTTRLQQLSKEAKLDKAQRENVSTLKQSVAALAAKLQKQKDHDLALLSFYADIVEKRPAKLPLPVNKDVVKNALLLSISHENDLMRKELLGYASHLETEDLRPALLLAAAIGNISMFDAILNCRKDVAFPNADLLNALKVALANRQDALIHYMLLNTKVKLDAETTRLLQAHVDRASLVISGVDAGFRQKFGDKDSVPLSHIRAAFLWQHRLLSSLKPEYEALLEKIRHSPQDPNLKAQALAYNRKIEQAIQIRRQMTDCYPKDSFGTPQRRVAHIAKWSRELGLVAQDYRNGLEAYLPTTPTVTEAPVKALEKELEAAIIKGSAKGLNDVLDRLQEQTVEHHQVFHRILSSAINQAANLDQAEMLDLLLLRVDDPKLNMEYAHNALREAFSKGSVKAVELLFDNEAYEKMESFILSQLLEIYHNPGDPRQAVLPQLAFTVFTRLPVTPSTEMFDILARTTPDSKFSAIPPVTTGTWQNWVSDSDGPFLTQLRNIYLLCEMAYQKLSTDALKLSEQFEQDLPRGLSDAQVEEYDDKVKLMEMAIYRQKEMLQLFLKQFQAMIEPKITNTGRKDKDITKWKAALQKVITTEEERYIQYINGIKEPLDALQKKRGKEEEESPVIPRKHVVLQHYRPLHAVPPKPTTLKEGPLLGTDKRPRKKE
ncbi:MAG: hypothetical protein ACHQJ6_00345 [Candidatus Berkiellales bacterium]